MDSCAKVSRYLLVIFNLLIFCVGIGGLALGIWILLEKNQFEQLIGSMMYTSAAYLLVVAGGVIVVLAFFGCMGALKEVKCMLVTFFLFLFIIFILLMAGAILGYVFRSEVEVSMKRAMEETLLRQYGLDVRETPDTSVNLQHQAVTDAWDYMQKNFKCCAAGNFTNPQHYVLWARSHWCVWGVDNVVTENKPTPPDGGGRVCVPNSCCGKADATDGGPGCLRTEIYKLGCYEAGYTFISEYAEYIGGVGIGVSAALIIGMILVIVVYRQVE